MIRSTLTGGLVAVLCGVLLTACFSSGPSSTPSGTSANPQTSSGASPTKPTSFPCTSPKANSDGQPAVAVILLDGVPSQEAGSAYYPFPVTKPWPGIPVVENFCPLDGAYQERAVPDLPPGLDSSLRRWSEFSVPGGSSGGSSAPSVSRACDRPMTRSIPAPAPGPAQPGPAPIPNFVQGGFGHGDCLTEALADAGAVLLPYSYTGAVLGSSGVFTQPAYTADDSKQGLCISVNSLAGEINSVHSAWPSTAIFVVGHSYGGLVAEQWWYGEHSQGGGQCRLATGNAGVVHVFSLDSPINGVQHCTLASVQVGDASKTWCDLWTDNTLHGVPNGLKIAAIDDHDLSFTAVGTPNDPAYTGFFSGGGGLEPQLVYDCWGTSDQNNPSDQCIDKTGGALPVSFPSASPACDGGSGNVDGTTGHDMVKACPAVIQLIVHALHANTSTPTSTTTTPPPPQPSTNTTTCGGISIFDYVQGDQCTHIGGLLTADRVQLTVGDLTPGTSDSGKPELCAPVKGINTTSDPKFLTVFGFDLESAGPGPGVSLEKGGTTVNLQSPIGGTLNDVGTLAAGATGTGTVCFDAGITSGQQVLIIYTPAAQGRSIWVK
jgi:hypothetical protein